MLIEFSVTNFRSIRETQTLSMVSSKYYKELGDTNCFDPKLPRFPKLLHTAVVYGPNAAGKSNLLRAFYFMRRFVLESHSHQEGVPIDIASFALSSELSAKPSEFEIIFIHDKVRYHYGFAILENRITREILSAYPGSKAQLWYERNYDPNTGNEQWDFGSKFTGQRNVWRYVTRKNALFLSTAIQLNSEQLKPVFDWFQNKVAVVSIRGVNPGFSIDECDSDESKRKKILEFMNSADISISGIEVEKTPFTPEMIPLETPQAIKEDLIKKLSGTDVKNIRFKHQTMNGESVYFEMKYESSGTQKLFAFAGPWLDVLAKGKIIVVDELDTSLHPFLVRYLVNLIQNPNTNKHGAQLIFTTHDMSLLSAEIFRRDQIWFMEKDRTNASKLYSLSEFKARKNEAIENGYLKGRYGALPSIEDFSF